MKRLLSCAATGIDRISIFIGQSSSVLLFACILASAVEVLLRYGFDSPTLWSTELSMTLCATAWVLAVGSVTQRNRHIAITMIEGLISPAAWRRLRLVQMLASVLAVGTLTVALWKPAMKVLARPEYSGTAMNSLQPSYLKVLLLVGCGLYLLQLAANIIRWVQRTEKEIPGGH
ncbi:TRAP transporter small permease subunit [Novispirillum itersonii]|uniref:TRAP transporter small permease protein n=1 Tax=Novispirillum itersonii TaxID=189 RepID=A0A7X0DK84_NOVIT|nr:TRAP transporter small permease [Novispirillum itersonii]MBB6208683.1 TRAP-type C4-dicarboxylate transport system permease small subunit [Novispirillum itersonii]